MKLCINDFEGPLDLLLHLVKTAKMDIYEIDTKYIIDKYLEFIESIPKDDLDDASEYLVMAAELIHLKSRLLLNLDNDDSDNEEFSINSEEDLKNKLDNYFWRGVFNLGSKAENRMIGYDIFNEGFKLIGGNAKKYMQPNWNATRNFHGVWYYDGDKLEKLFHY